MSPHLKIAFIVAPFLLIGGYIAADFYQSSKESEYLEAEAQKTAAYQLVPDAACNLPAGDCILRKEDLRLTVSVDKDYYYLDSNRELSGVMLGLAQSDRITRPVQLEAREDRKHWRTLMRPLSNLKTEQPLLLRVAIEHNGKRYFSELEVSTDGPWSLSDGN
jgi:hypothetical protein